MKLSDIIKLHINPATGYEINPEELVPNGGKWTEINEDEYEQGGLVKDIIGTSIRMRQKSPSKFNVNVFVNTTDRGTVTGSGEYYYGETVTIGAVANTGFIFTHWQDGNTENPRIIQVDGPMDFIANFKREQLTYTIQVRVKEGQTSYGEVYGGGVNLHLYENVRIWAIPKEGYRFVRWNDGNTECDRIVEVIGDKTYTAEFAREQYTIKVKPNNISWGGTTGEGTYYKGDIVEITANAYAGYLFERWNDGNTSPSRNITVLNDAEYTAFFKEELPTTAEITVKSNDISMGDTDPSGSHTYEIGSTIQIKAIANEGYQFKAWDDDNSAPAIRNITVTGNATYTASFQPEIIEKCKLILDKDPRNGGIVKDMTAGSDGSGIYPIDTECTVIAEAYDGFEFDGWYNEGDDTPVYSGLVYVFYLTADTTLIAKFSPIPELPKYRVALEGSPEDGCGYLDGEGEYTQGDTCIVRTIAAQGYTFVRWSENDRLCSTDAEYEFTVTRDINLTAEFTKDIQDTHEVTVIIVTDGDPNNHQGGISTGTGTYDDNDVCYLNAQNNKGYEFVEWVFNNIDDTPVSQELNYSFNVTRDTIVYAKFRTIPSFSVTVSSDPVGAAMTYGDGTYTKGEIATVGVRQRSINDGYILVAWLINGEEIPVIENKYEYSFKVVSTTNVIAVFRYHDPSTQYYSVTTNCEPENSGVVTPSGCMVEAGSEFSVKAVPDKNHRLKNWKVTVNDVTTVEPIQTERYDTNEYVFTVTGDTVITAVFEEISSTRYIVNVTCDPDKGGIVTGNRTRYNAGESCTLTAKPNDEFEFKKWVVNGVEVATTFIDGAPVCIFPVNSNSDVIAYFEQLSSTKYNVTTNITTNDIPNNEDGGYIEGNTSPYNANAFCTLTAKSNAGYEFNGWLVNNEPLSGGKTPNPYTFKVDSDKIITAKFVSSDVYQHIVNVTCNPDKGGIVTGNASRYTHGATCELEIKPNEGFQLKKVTINGVAVTVTRSGDNATCTFNVESDSDVIVYFEQTDLPKYTISTTVLTDNVPSNNGGYIEGNDSPYDACDVCTLTAKSNKGYGFAGWLVDGEELSGGKAPNPYTFEVDRDMVITAKFNSSDPSQYTVNVTIDPIKGGTVTGNANRYTEGSPCTLNITPNVGYRFNRMTVNGSEVTVTRSGDNASYTFNVDSDSDVVVYFEQTSLPTYTINTVVYTDNVQNNKGGSISGNDSPYTAGDACTLTANANSGYKFAGWLVDGEELSGGKSPNPYTFVVDRGMTITAKFVSSTLPQHTVNVTVDPIKGGTVTGNANRYMEGSPCTLNITPNMGYRFDRMTINGNLADVTRSGNNATCTFNVDSDSDVVVYFVQTSLPTYTIETIVRTDNVQSDAGGSISGNNSPYDAGDACTLTANTNSGYKFAGWLVDGEELSGGKTPNPYTFVVDRGMTITAKFVSSTLPQHTVNVTIDPIKGGTVTGNTNRYMEGSPCTLNITPNIGYRFNRMTVNGSEVTVVRSGDNATYTFNVDSDSDVVVYFEQTSLPTYTIETIVRTDNVQSSAGGSISGNNSPYDAGDACTLTANTNSGYKFAGWLVDGEELSGGKAPNPYTFVVNKGMTITAKFVSSTLPQHIVNVTIDPIKGGTVTGNDHRYTEGSPCTLNITPNVGYRFDRMTINGNIVDVTRSGNNATCTFNVNSDSDVVVYFEQTSLPTYTINTVVHTNNAQSNAGGSISGNNSPYNAGDACILTANANSGYKFAGWLVDGEELSGGKAPNPYAFVVDKGMTITAKFVSSTLPQHIVNVTIDPIKGGTVTGNANRYTEGSPCTLNITPNVGYQFNKMTVNGSEVTVTHSGGNATYTFNVDSDSDVIVYFTQTSLPTYTINTVVYTDNVQSSTGGSISGNNSTYNAGDACILTANANSGYKFAGWLVDGEELSGGKSPNPYTFVVDKGMTITAKFVSSTLPQHTVNVTVDPIKGGTVTGNDHRYTEGSPCTLNITPNIGYRFNRMTVNGSEVTATRSGNNATYTFNVDSDSDIVVYFEPTSLPTYTVDTIVLTDNVQSNVGGSISGNDSSYDAGGVCILTATPNSGYKFAGWLVDGEELSGGKTPNPYTFVVDKGVTITAKFVSSTLPQHTVNVTIDPIKGGTVTGNDHRYTEGSPCTLNITPNIGYQFNRMTINGSIVTVTRSGDNATYTFNVDSDSDIVVYFEPTSLPTYTVDTVVHTDNAQSNAGGSISGNNSPYTVGDACILTATPNTGYKFTGWLVDGEELSGGKAPNPYTFVVDKGITITAKFVSSTLPQHTVNVTVDPIKGGTVTGNTNRYTEGSPCTLNITPNMGYQFDRMTVNGSAVTVARSGSNATYTFDVNSDSDVVVYFEPIGYTINTAILTDDAQSNAGGSISGNDSSYDAGDACTLTATPNAGYKFDGWLVDNVPLSDGKKPNPYTFVVDGSKTITAKFVSLDAPQHIVNVTISPDGGGVVTGNSTRYTAGSSCTLTATPSAGYEFDRMTVNGSEVIVTRSGDSATYTFNVNSDSDVIAYFTKSSLPTYTINTAILTDDAQSNAGGSISGNTTSISAGDVCILTATPNTGYKFDGWLVDGEELSGGKAPNPYTFVVDGAKTITAKFVSLASPKYTVNVTISPDGSGTVTGNSNRYTAGSSCVITATPSTGYEVDKITINGNNASINRSGGNATCTFNVNSDSDVVVYFKPIGYTISTVVLTDEAQSNTGGSISGNNSPYDAGDACTLTANTNSGYKFAGWLVDNVPLSDGKKPNPYTFEVDGSKTITAKFVSLSSPKYTVNVTISPDGSGTVTGNSTRYTAGSSCVLTAIPNTGYEVDRMTVNGSEVTVTRSSNNATYTFNVNSDSDVVVYFKPIGYTISTVVLTDEAQSNTGGSISGNTTSYNTGDVCTLTATPNTGYKFTGWLVNGEELSGGKAPNPYTFVVDGSKTITAKFVSLASPKHTVNVTVSPSDGGTVTGNANRYTVGSSCDLIAIPNAGYEVDKITINGNNASITRSGGNATCTFNVNSDSDVIVYFTPIQYSVSTVILTNGGQSNAGGSISGNDSPYNAGDTCILTATPNTGYRFIGWLVDGEELSGGKAPNPYTFEITDNIEITAKFGTSAVHS